MLQLLQHAHCVQVQQPCTCTCSAAAVMHCCESEQQTVQHCAAVLLHAVTDDPDGVSCAGCIHTAAHTLLSTTIHTNAFCSLHKCICQFRQIHLEIWTNTFCGSAHHPHSTLALSMHQPDRKEERWEGGVWVGKCTIEQRKFYTVDKNSPQCRKLLYFTPCRVYSRAASQAAVHWKLGCLMMWSFLLSECTLSMSFGNFLVLIGTFLSWLVVFGALSWYLIWSHTMWRRRAAFSCQNAVHCHTELMKALILWWPRGALRPLSILYLTWISWLDPRLPSWLWSLVHH